MTRRTRLFRRSRLDLRSRNCQHSEPPESTANRRSVRTSRRALWDERARRHERQIGRSRHGVAVGLNVDARTLPPESSPRFGPDSRPDRSRVTIACCGSSRVGVRERSTTRK